jgi:amino acid adenylation domain-containing protein
LENRMSSKSFNCVMNNQQFNDGVQMVEKANVSCHNYDQGLCLPLLVAKQAEQTPDAVALSFGSLLLTYKQLDQRANCLAHHLVSLGVGPDVVVGIYLNRSLAVAVSALAVFKAGGAYLPLDPVYPADRLAYQMRDAQAQILMTGQCMTSNLPLPARHIVTVDPDGRSDALENSESINSQATPENLAYVIYTSGSSGQPKGVELTHGGLLNLVNWHLCAFKVSREDRASQLSALAFDAAVWELWPYLTVGASVHMPEGIITTDAEAVRDWYVTQGITIGFLPTPLAERAIMLKWPAKTKLRTLLTGADTLHHYPSRKLPFRLVNNYGPTECTVVATSGIVVPKENHDQLPSIGRAIDNVQVHILDENRQPVPNGQPGELYVSGANLARGYRNRPDLTAERFVRNASGSDRGARLYRTGDLARQLPDGEIAFLGRIDDQIKIRGFRIEPAEIVKILDEHPAIQASVVVAREIVAGDKQLVAYFLPLPKAQPTHSELRNFLAKRLPEYMVPATFVKLRNLPLNPSGKVDRTALPMPDAENTLRDSTFVAPRTPIEERVAVILASLLGVEQVSVNDNFFLIGGHSLLGTQLIANIRAAFGVELTLLRVFDAPTVAMLSEQIEVLLESKIENMNEEEAENLLRAIASGTGSL